MTRQPRRIEIRGFFRACEKTHVEEYANHEVPDSRFDRACSSRVCLKGALACSSLPFPPLLARLAHVLLRCPNAKIMFGCFPKMKYLD